MWEFFLADFSSTLHLPLASFAQRSSLHPRSLISAKCRKVGVEEYGRFQHSFDNEEEERVSFSTNRFFPWSGDQGPTDPM